MGRFPRSQDTYTDRKPVSYDIYDSPGSYGQDLIADKEASHLAHFSRPGIGMAMTPNIGHP